MRLAPFPGCRPARGRARTSRDLAPNGAYRTRRGTAHPHPRTAHPTAGAPPPLAHPSSAPRTPPRHCAPRRGTAHPPGALRTAAGGTAHPAGGTAHPAGALRIPSLRAPPGGIAHPIGALRTPSMGCAVTPWGARSGGRRGGGSVAGRGRALVVSRVGQAAVRWATSSLLAPPRPARARLRPPASRTQSGTTHPAGALRTSPGHCAPRRGIAHLAGALRTSPGHCAPRRGIAHPRRWCARSPRGVRGRPHPGRGPAAMRGGAGRQAGHVRGRGAGRASRRGVRYIVGERCVDRLARACGPRCRAPHRGTAHPTAAPRTPSIGCAVIAWGARSPCECEVGRRAERGSGAGRGAGRPAASRCATTSRRALRRPARVRGRPPASRPPCG